ncbi:PA2169 family four-helix-bundle protein [Pokkaliibacter sp. CJK22405]|uniref:PA2169 family four-helix-bundle protein n=1 Tax=Pokkaliibacter sp. CJK22405 TaxID=3384615 RepID=UPI0039850E62
MLTKDEKKTELKVLNQVLAVCEDGKSFYQHAAREVDSASLRRVFLEQAQARREAIQELTEEVQHREGSPVDNGTVSGTLQQWYTDIRASLSDSQDYQFIVALEEAETRSLNELKQAVRSLHNPRLASKLGSHLATIQLAHDRMKSIKDDMKRTHH